MKSKRELELQKKQKAIKQLESTRAVLIKLARAQANRLYQLRESPVTAGQVYAALSGFLQGNKSFPEAAELFKRADKRWLGAVFNPNNWTIDGYRPDGSHGRRVATWRPRGKL